MTKHQPVEPWDQLAKQITDLQNTVKALSQKGLSIPILDADPDASNQGYGNIWAFTDGRIHWRGPDGTIHEIASVASTGASSTVVKPAPPTSAPKSYQSTFDAAWTVSLGDGGVHSTGTLYWGYGDPYNGTQESGIGWPYADIEAALTGATVSKCEIYLTCTHTWNSSGATVYFSGATAASQPSTKSGLGVSTGLYNGTLFVAGESKWVSINTAFATRLAAGTDKATALLAKNTSHSYYGYMGGLPNYKPQLRVTYTK